MRQGRRRPRGGQRHETGGRTGENGERQPDRARHPLLQVRGAGRREGCADRQHAPEDVEEERRDAPCDAGRRGERRLGSTTATGLYGQGCHRGHHRHWLRPDPPDVQGQGRESAHQGLLRARQHDPRRRYRLHLLQRRPEGHALRLGLLQARRTARHAEGEGCSRFARITLHQHCSRKHL